MQVAFKVRNLPSKFGHARLLGSRIIRYVRDGRSDGRTEEQTDKSSAYCPFPTGGGIKNYSTTARICLKTILCLDHDLTRTIFVLKHNAANRLDRTVLPAHFYGPSVAYDI